MAERLQADAPVTERLQGSKMTGYDPAGERPHGNKGFKQDEDADEMGQVLKRGVSTAAAASTKVEPQVWQTTKYTVRAEMLADIFMRLRSKPKVDVFGRDDLEKCLFQVGWHHGYQWTKKWGPEILWLNPAPKDIKRTLEKVVCDQARGILIVPNWEEQSWTEQLWAIVQRYHYYGPGIRLYRDIQPEWGSWACLVDGANFGDIGEDRSMMLMTGQEVQRNKSVKRRKRRRTLMRALANTERH